MTCNFEPVARAQLSPAMAIFAPSRAKVAAISLPIPLAAPMTMATLSFMMLDQQDERVTTDEGK